MKTKIFDVQVTYDLKIMAPDMETARRALEKHVAIRSLPEVAVSAPTCKQLLINEEGFAK